MRLEVDGEIKLPKKLTWRMTVQVGVVVVQVANGIGHHSKRWVLNNGLSLNAQR